VYGVRVAVRLTVREAGWALVDPSAATPGLAVVVRFHRTTTGRLAVVELAVARHPGVTPDSLRAVRLGQIELWANGAGRPAVLATLADREAMSDDARREVDNRQRADADMRARWGTTPDAVAGQEQVPAVPLRSRVRSLRLNVPAGQPVPDAFYREVARVYGDVGLSSERPALDIAKANGVSGARVHGWIREARRRGFLAPGERQGRQR
jgi:hypothetical protein